MAPYYECNRNIFSRCCRLTSEYYSYTAVATTTEQEAEDCGSPTKTPGSESRSMEGSVSDYYTITALDVTPDDSKSNLFARGQHVTAFIGSRHITPSLAVPIRLLLRRSRPTRCQTSTVRSQSIVVNTIKTMKFSIVNSASTLRGE